MDFYEILGVMPSADSQQLKKAYLQAAKKYHPDIYKGVNSGHFQKVNEAFNVLKFAHKRKDYDRKMKIHKMRDNKEFQAMAQKAKMQGREFTYQDF
jgi:DnaJ-class molecular chaperone